MPRLPSLNVSGFLPEGVDLDRALARLATRSSASDNTRERGLARLAAMDERDELERSENAAKEKEQRTFIREMQKKRTEDILARNENATKQSERSALVQEFIVNAKVINQHTPNTFTPDQIASTVSTMLQRPLKQTDEQKAAGELTKTANTETVKNSTPESLIEFSRALRETGTPDFTLLKPKGEKPTARKFVKQDGNLYEVVGISEENPLGLKLQIEGEDKPPSASERKQNRLDAAEEDHIKALDALDNTPGDLTLLVKAARTATDANIDRVQGRKQRKELDEVTEALLRFDQLGGDALKIIQNSKTSASGTIAGAGAKAVRGFSDTLSGLVALLPKGEPNFDISRAKYKTQLNELARGNDELQSLYYGIAFLNIVANGLSGTRVTNLQFEKALEDAKGSAGSPAAITNKLNAIRDRMVGRAKAKANVILGDEHLQLSEEFPTTAPAPPSNREAYLQRLRERAAQQ